MLSIQSPGRVDKSKPIRILLNWKSINLAGEKEQQKANEQHEKNFENGLENVDSMAGVGLIKRV